MYNLTIVILLLLHFRESSRLYDLRVSELPIIFHSCKHLVLVAVFSIFAFRRWLFQLYTCSSPYSPCLCSLHVIDFSVLIAFCPPCTGLQRQGSLCGSAVSVVLLLVLLILFFFLLYYVLRANEATKRSHAWREREYSRRDCFRRSWGRWTLETSTRRSCTD